MKLKIIFTKSTFIIQLMDSEMGGYNPAKTERIRDWNYVFRERGRYVYLVKNSLQLKYNT